MTFILNGSGSSEPQQAAANPPFGPRNVDADPLDPEGTLHFYK